MPYCLQNNVNFRNQLYKISKILTYGTVKRHKRDVWVVWTRGVKLWTADFAGYSTFCHVNTSVLSMLPMCLGHCSILMQSRNRRAHIGVNAEGVTGVRTPQYLTCRGPSMSWNPAIIPTQSCVRCTIFFNIIDFVVSAVVEQFCAIPLSSVC